MLVFFFFKQKTAYELRISDWSSDVCSSDLLDRRGRGGAGQSAQCRGVARADAGGARRAAEGGRHFAGGGAGADGRIEAGRSCPRDRERRSEEHTSELQSLMRISYAVFCLKKKNKPQLYYSDRLRH